MSDLFDRAAVFAIHAHAGAVRKREPIPYILHPMEVAAIAASMTEDREVLAAAMLHDTVEDAGVTVQEIEAAFGPRVAALVAHESEDKHRELPPSVSWRLRKEESLARLRDCGDIAVKMLWVADKLSNLRQVYREWLTLGPAVWAVFNQKDPAQQQWYYESSLELTRELRDTAAWQELSRLVGIIFG